MLESFEMALRNDINHRLPLYGPLSIKKLEDFLEVSKKQFKKKYLMKFPNRVNFTDYELIHLIGEGAFGKVLLVRSLKSTNSYFAVKALRKSYLVREKEVKHALNEMRVLQSIDSPFCVRLECFSQDNSYIYFFMPFLCGGEMFTHLRHIKRFDETLSRFYAIQVVLGLEYLHNLNIAYRDLKPENLLIDHLGYLKVADMGFAKILSTRTYTFCGTPDYIAPEIILGRGYGLSADWWALGVLIYEMNSGEPPFGDEESMKILYKIVNNEYIMPNDFSVELQDLIRKIMNPDVSMRFGNLKGGAQDIKDHKWFDKIDWMAMLNRRVLSPYIPLDAEIVGSTYLSTPKHSLTLKICDRDRFEEHFKDF